MSRATVQTAEFESKMIDRVIAKGMNPRDAQNLLEELLLSHEGGNLIHALRHWNFITAGQAEMMMSNWWKGDPCAAG